MALLSARRERTAHTITKSSFQRVITFVKTLLAVAKALFLRIGTLPPAPSLKIKRGGDRSALPLGVNPPVAGES